MMFVVKYSVIFMIAAMLDVRSSREEVGEPAFGQVFFDCERSTKRVTIGVISVEQVVDFAVVSGGVPNIAIFEAAVFHLLLQLGAIVRVCRTLLTLQKGGN